MFSSSIKEFSTNSSHLLLLGCACAAGLLVNHLLEEQRTKLDTNDIPGTIGFPLLGETISFVFGPRKFIADRFRKFGSRAFRTKIVGKDVVFVRGPLIQYVAENEAFSSLQLDNINQMLEGFLLIQDGKEHTRNRQLINQALTLRVLKLNLNLMADHFTKALEVANTKKNQTVEMFHFTKNVLFASMVNILFGQSSADFTPALMDEVLHLFVEFGGGALNAPINLGKFSAYGRCLIARDRLFKIVEKVVESRMANKKMVDTKDVLQSFIDHRDEEFGKNATSRDIAKGIMALLYASVDTNSSLVASVLLLLHKHPQALEKVRIECEQVWGKENSIANLSNGEIDQKLHQLTYLDCVVKETLRVHGPIATFFRTAMEEVVLPGEQFIIPKGALVGLAYASSMELDDVAFPEPQSFNPDRFLPNGCSEKFTNTYTGVFMPFGVGKHGCPGRNFAQMETMLIISILSQRKEWPVIMSPTTNPWMDIPIFEMVGGMNVKLF